MSNYTYKTADGLEVVYCDKCAKAEGLAEYDAIDIAPRSKPCAKCNRFQENLSDSVLAGAQQFIEQAFKSDETPDIAVPDDNFVGAVMGMDEFNALMTGEGDEEDYAVPEWTKQVRTPDGRPVFPTEEELAQWLDEMNKLSDRYWVDSVPDECKNAENALVVAMMEHMVVPQSLGGIPNWTAGFLTTHHELHGVAHTILMYGYLLGLKDRK